jgi:16S rRNA (uracil1498-N3)-methyltransferase
VPQVAPVLPLASWLAGGGFGGRRLLLSPRASVVPLRAAGPGDVCALSGPEGGLSAAEEEAALAAGFVRTGLGPRVLRADTAPLAVLAWLAMQA